MQIKISRLRIVIVGLMVMVATLGNAQFFDQGANVPEIKLEDLNGKELSLSSLRGKLVLVDFWASWCGPCRNSNKALVKVYEQYKSTGFEIFGVSLDNDKAAWKKAVQNDKITWKQVNEQGGWEAKVAQEWGIEALPTSYLLDEDGKVLLADPSIDQIKTILKSRQKSMQP